MCFTPLSLLLLLVLSLAFGVASSARAASSLVVAVWPDEAELDPDPDPDDVWFDKPLGPNRVPLLLRFDAKLTESLLPPLLEACERIVGGRRSSWNDTLRELGSEPNTCECRNELGGGTELFGRDGAMPGEDGEEVLLPFVRGRDGRPSAEKSASSQYTV